MKRSSGVLMHISTLFGNYSIGSFGENAKQFIDFLEKGGFSYWQVLPFYMTDEYNSPYQSYSAFSANTEEVSRTADIPTFYDGVVNLLREDSDIVVVGEIRDRETAQTAIEAGQTGHLVLTTVHTTDAIEAITRIRKMGISDYDVSASIVTVVSQRLLRMLCPKCKKPHTMTEEEKNYFERVEEVTHCKLDMDNVTMFEPAGCKDCNNLGYIERTGVFEVLCIDDMMKHMIASGASPIELREYAIKNTERNKRGNNYE